MAKKKLLGSRAAGILMPVSSLPSNYGIGALGQSARDFADFLAAAGQRFWQVLPLSPTGYGASPYQSSSAFAGNPYLVDLDILMEQGLLTRGELNSTGWGKDPAKADYEAVGKGRDKLLKKAFSRFKDFDALEAFKEEQGYWLKDYANYTNDAGYTCFVQYLFFTQYAALKAYANSRGVYIIGDIPIYVSLDSADVKYNRELFLLDEDGVPVDVAGCPPDAFTKDGQLWGNPLYRWDVMEKDGYAWWIKRLKHNLDMYDVLRIDHFRGLESYYTIPYGRKNARVGEWRKGPGNSFIDAINRELPGAEIIAEDLGFITPAVRRLLRYSGYPGMKVLQFGFSADGGESDYMPHNFPKRCVAYTGTHDNDTAAGWFASAKRRDAAVARSYLGVSRNRDGAQAMIRAALGSVANLAVIPMQDYLGLGGGARMNIPSTVGGDNWRWRVLPDAATPELAEHIRAMTKIYGRIQPGRLNK